MQYGAYICVTSYRKHWKTLLFGVSSGTEGWVRLYTPMLDCVINSISLGRKHGWPEMAMFYAIEIFGTLSNNSDTALCHCQSPQRVLHGDIEDLFN